MILSDSVKLLSGSRVEAAIRISRDFVKCKYDEFLKDYSSRLKVQGFRVGKVPLAVIESKYSGNLRALTVEKVIHESLENFFKSAVYKPLSYAVPRILEEKLEIDFEKDFEFTVLYEAYPEFEIPDIDDVVVEMPEVIIDDFDVEDRLKQLQAENSIVVEDKGSVERGSIVRVDFVELDDSLSEISSTRRQDFVFTVGESNNYYGFDEDIVGMGKGEERVVEKSYKEDYRFKELAGSDKRLKIAVTDIKRRDVPKLDDDFAKDISDSLNTLEELKDRIKLDMLELVKEKEEALKLSKLLSGIAERLNIEVPPSMFKAELDSALSRFSEQNKIGANQFGGSLNDLEVGVDDVFKGEVLKNLKSRLILQKMVANDGEEVTDVDLDQELARQAESARMELAEIRKFYEERDLLHVLRNEIKSRKVKSRILKDVKEVRVEKIPFRDFFNREIGG
ncbi:trigger factor [Borrelia sp. BU AG58]|uniref:trigger factor n=1 Tax=Borrelia sp. BU AG58 TaxID=2887345 RepID=UPI001E5B6FDF|nr:trigger factor [Borrelia sp. BU AG58]UER67767.1 trigger factor [Borrelia sp. BU AG58]